MKNLKVLFLGFILLAGSSFFAATNAKNRSNQDEKKTEVNVYYFHTNIRCVTCRAVESETKKNVEELFGNKVRFTAVNLDDEASEPKGKELGVKGTGLLVIKGDKKIELTAQGFMYARTNPEKFRQIMKEKIQPLL
ncbi:MAG: nitrophenyl compound nitroreductase subunit ArsF family protein [Mariniphaga sp.]|nr:nitrophenyl compound nitroreductase subunit ArsF family protein [Mariniphaga sp.]MDD4227533.1 nitrophenyl compound nitroreductase subunit ArsF family protein [Mariniphaga sp.]